MYVKYTIYGSGYPTPPQDLLFWGSGLIDFTDLIFPEYLFCPGEYR